MKVLMLSYSYLDGTGGGVFATRAYINAVASIAERTVLLVKRKQNAAPSGIEPRVEVRTITDDSSKLKKGIRLLTGTLHPFREAMEIALAQERFDLVFFCSSIASYGLVDLARSHGCSVVTLHHNYEYEYYRDNMSGWLRHVYLFWVPRFEGDAVRKSDVNLTLTEEDMSLLIEKYGGDPARFNVTGVFEYADKALPDPVPGRAGFDFVITGTLSAVQTYMSLKRWIEKYLPVLKEEVPECTVTVAGRNPSAQLTRLMESNGCRVIASPESMDSVLESATCYICPIELGGGLKLRVMDGLRKGLKVITHDVSLRGYAMFKDRFVFHYHDVSTFKKALYQCRTGSATPRQIQDAYYEVFSFRSGVQRLEKVLKEL